jgi:peptidoglycan/LPS O-acetylase OafA/YrhL
MCERPPDSRSRSIGGARLRSDCSPLLRIPLRFLRGRAAHSHSNSRRSVRRSAVVVVLVLELPLELPTSVSPVAAAISASHFWTLAVEKQFYLFWRAIVLTTSRKGLIRVCLVCRIGSVLLRIAIHLMGVDPGIGYRITPARLDMLMRSTFFHFPLAGLLQRLGLSVQTFPTIGAPSSPARSRSPSLARRRRSGLLR